MNPEPYFESLFSLKNKVSIITGASSGIGRQIATSFAKAGSNLVLIARRQTHLEKLKKELKPYNVDIHILPFDLSDISQTKTHIADILNQLKEVHILVNNAGYVIRGETSQIPIEAVEKDWNEQMNLNLRSVYLVSKLVGDHMKERGIPGSIINIASVRGDRCPASGSTIYAASKAGVIQLSKALAIEYAKSKIRVNAISPGLFLTDINKEFLTPEIEKNYSAIIPLHRLAQVHEIEGIALLLASNSASSYITGSIFTIDGGLSSGIIVN